MSHNVPKHVVAKTTSAGELPAPAITNQVMSFSATNTVPDTKNMGAIWGEGQLCRVAATDDCYIRYDDTVDTDATSSDTLMIRGVEAMLMPKSLRCISVLAANSTVTLTITLYQ